MSTETGSITIAEGNDGDAWRGPSFLQMSCEIVGQVSESATSIVVRVDENIERWRTLRRWWERGKRSDCKLTTRKAIFAFVGDVRRVTRLKNTGTIEITLLVKGEIDTKPL